MDYSCPETDVCCIPTITKELGEAQVKECSGKTSKDGSPQCTVGDQCMLIYDPCRKLQDEWECLKEPSCIFRPKIDKSESDDVF